MIKLVEQSKLKPVIDSVRPISQTKDALDVIAAGKQTGKLVLTIGDASASL